MNKLERNQKVTIYYDRITLGGRENGHIIHSGCPSVKVPWKESIEYAEKKIDSKAWSVYIIPELNSLTCHFPDEEGAEYETEFIKCPNKCSEEEFSDDDYEGTGMFTPIFLNGRLSRPEYICNICGADAEIV